MVHDAKGKNLFGIPRAQVFVCVCGSNVRCLRPVYNKCTASDVCVGIRRMCVSMRGVCRLRMECTTWNRDSHELFDYESRHVFSKKYLMRKTAKVFRCGLDVQVVPEGNELPLHSDFLLSIRGRDNSYFVYPADKTACPPLANIQPRKLWLIIKHLNRSSFPLTEGDIIKLGRFRLRVRQIAADQNQPGNLDFSTTHILSHRCAD